MTQKLKVLGVVLGAVFAIGAVGASVASAAEETKAGLFVASTESSEFVKLDGEQISAGKNTVALNGLTFTCTTATLSGNMLTTGSSATEITLTPNYEKCHVVVAGITKTVTITTNGCAFVLNAKVTTTENSEIDNIATTTIECPESKQIEFHIYEEKEAEVKTLCTYDVGPQGPLSGIALTNKVNTPGSADDILSVPNITVSVTNTKLSVLCGQKEATTAAYKGEDTIRATNAAKAFVDLAIAEKVVPHETRAGFFTANVGAEVIAGVDGEQIKTGTITLNGLSMTCTTIKLTGNTLTIGPSATKITLTPKYETCHVVVAGITKFVTFTSNHCAFLIDAKATVTESGAVDFLADTEVECEKPGEQIEIHVYEEKEAEAKTLCTYDIKPQGPLSGSTIGNKINTSSSANDVVAGINVTLSVTNTKLSLLCGSNEATTAAYKEEDTLRATNAVSEFVDLSISG